MSKWNHQLTDRGIEIGWGASSFTHKVVMINPASKSYNCRSYVLWFGTCGATYLHVFACSLEDALEQCASWLIDYAPGHIMVQGSDEHVELVREAAEERGYKIGESMPEGLGDEIFQAAEADLTYTESGFLTSYEWGISMENPTPDDLYKFIKGD